MYVHLYIYLFIFNSQFLTLTSYIIYVFYIECHVVIQCNSEQQQHTSIILRLGVSEIY